ncbi:MAG: type II toxin-antitoxin system VapC family toxin [Rubrobacteraceae bacterium]
MRGVVIADAGPLYALRDSADTLHQRAGEDQKRLESRRLKTAISYSTLTECHALILRKLGMNEARSFLVELTATSYFLTPTTQDYEKAVAKTLRYPDQDITLADAITAEVSDRLDVPVWTFDHHFDMLRPPEPARGLFRRMIGVVHRVWSKPPSQVVERRWKRTQEERWQIWRARSVCRARAMYRRSRAQTSRT